MFLIDISQLGHIIENDQYRTFLKIDLIFIKIKFQEYQITESVEHFETKEEMDDENGVLDCNTK